MPNYFFFFRWAGDLGNGNVNPTQLKVLKPNPVVSGLFLPFPVADKINITSFNIHAAPFFLTFESISGSTYKIEASHDLKKWGEISEVKGTGGAVKFTDWREAIFEKQFYRVKVLE